MAQHGMCRPGRRKVFAATLAAALGASLALPLAASASLSVPARTWGTNGRVNAILPVGDRIFVGGSFTSVVDTDGVAYNAKGLAVFSATTGRADLGFQVGVDNMVTSLTTDGASTLYIGGQFTTVINGATSVGRKNLAAVDSATGAVTGWAPAASGGFVDSVAYSSADGAVYAGGSFGSVTGTAGTLSPRPFIARIDASTGVVDGGFQAAPDARVRSLHLANGGNRLYLGGEFSTVSGASRKKIAAVVATTGAVDTGWVPGPTNLTTNAPVYDIVADATRVYLAAGGSGGACTALNATTGAQVWSDRANGNLQSVRVQGATVYCGGHFTGDGSFLGAHRDKLAAVDAATGTLQSFAPRINSALGVWSLGAQAGDLNLYVGGDFTAVNGKPQGHYAQFVDSTLQSPPTAPANLLAQPGNGHVQLTWSVPSSDGGREIRSYAVYRGTSTGGENLSQPVVTIDAATSARAYDDAGLTNGTTYFYVVKAINAIGASPASNEASATPTDGAVTVPPGAPVDLVASNPPGHITLTWNPPVSDGGAPVVSYNVYRGTAPGAEGATPYATGVTARSFDDTSNLVAFTTYYYVVTAVNTAGEGVRSTEVSAVQQPGVPGTPVLSGVVQPTAINLSWTVPADGGSPITKYVILRNAVRLDTTKATQTTYSDTTAQPGTTYVYQVRAVNAQGNGDLSNKVTLTR